MKIKLPNTVKSVAAKIQVQLADGSVLHRTFVVGEGLRSDQTHTQIFGLENQSATAIKVSYLNGETKNESGSFVNQTISM